MDHRRHDTHEANNREECHDTNKFVAIRVELKCDLLRIQNVSDQTSLRRQEAC